MGLSENVGLIFPTIASHFSKRDNDQQNQWVQWGLANIFRHIHVQLMKRGPCVEAKSEGFSWHQGEGFIFQHVKKQKWTDSRK